MADIAEDSGRLAVILGQAKHSVTKLLEATERLHELMLTGRPPDIAEAVVVLDEARVVAEPSLLILGDSVSTHDCKNLADLASRLRRQRLTPLAGEVEELGRLLRRLAQRSATAKQNADNLKRGLSNSVQMLRGLGILREFGLLAEA
jgi:hypothetical protein